MIFPRDASIRIQTLLLVQYHPRLLVKTFLITSYQVAPWRNPSGRYPAKEQTTQTDFWTELEHL